MRKKIIALLCAAVLVSAVLISVLLTACGSSGSMDESTESMETTEVTAEESAAVSEEAANDEPAEAAEEEAAETADEENAETAEEAEDADADDAEADTDSADAAVLEDGVYTAEFNTDSSMFHVNEALDGKGTLTVKNGEMTIHVSLVSQNIVNLYVGLAEDAEAEGAELLEPTVDEVTYSDGITEEVYGFDIPVEELDTEFDVAIIGTKGVWYDHKVSVTNPEPAEE